MSDPREALCACFHALDHHQYAFGRCRGVYEDEPCDCEGYRPLGCLMDLKPPDDD